MSMRFSYVRVTGRRPIPSLAGQLYRPRPLIPVTLLGPAGSIARDALLDTGADDTVFSDVVAHALGIDLTNAPTGEASGAGMVPVALRYAQVRLRVTDGREFRDWSARIGFTSARLKQPLLGFAGFLQYFTAKFDGDLEEVELTINRKYPGT
jgi:predicted aspartyl protease